MTASQASFAPAWLAAREPADHAARNRDVLSAVAVAFAGRESLAMVDLACGSGSTLRGCALMLPARQQRWTLVDHDPLLLAAARERMFAWADDAQVRDAGLTLRKAGTTIAVDFRQADLRNDTEPLLDDDIDIVTASALFDLVSPEWITELVAVLKARALPLYAAMTYNGQELWLPAHPDDDAVHRAFLSHQRQAKTFGPAAGSDAGRVLVDVLTRADYRVTAGDSPWRLGATEADLVKEVANGIAAAAAETTLVSGETAEAWARFRRDAAASPNARSVIGHVDIYGSPGNW